MIVESEILDVKDFDKEATKLSYIKFLRKIDNTGELLNDKELIDFVKQSRNMRADLISRTIDEARYLEFTKARSATFANKNKHKFSDWIGACGKLCFFFFFLVKIKKKKSLKVFYNI